MTTLQVSAQKQLRQIVEQIERLAGEQTALADDIKDQLGEAKSLGFDPRIIRRILKLRKQSPKERAEEQAILDVYLQALGMAGTPMGDYMAKQEQETVN